jgi:hypothetical protein
MNADVESGYAEWSRRMFLSLRIGGVWGVPRSGLIFTRTGETTLALTDVMPYEDGMPISRPALYLQQQSDYDQIRHYMEVAGVAVSDSTGTFLDQ